MAVAEIPFYYLKNVLGIRSVLRSESEENIAGVRSEILEDFAADGTGSRQSTANADFESETHLLFGPEAAPFGFILPTTHAFDSSRGWNVHLSESDAAQFEKMILATGHTPEKIHLLFVNENKLSQLKRAELDELIQKTSRWIVMGTSLVSLIWQNRPIISARGQVHTLKTSYLWPTWGLWEMNANPALKREVWADMKRAFQGFLIEAPGKQTKGSIK